jgi:hypothetical protein
MDIIPAFKQNSCILTADTGSIIGGRGSQLTVISPGQDPLPGRIQARSCFDGKRQGKGRDPDQNQND